MLSYDFSSNSRINNNILTYYFDDRDKNRVHSLNFIENESKIADTKKTPLESGVRNSVRFATTKNAWDEEHVPALR